MVTTINAQQVSLWVIVCHLDSLLISSSIMVILTACVIWLKYTALTKQRYYLILKWLGSVAQVSISD